MEHVDHVAARVSLFTFTGLIGGGVGAVLAGYPRRSTAIKVSLSFGLVSVTLFTFERLAFVALGPSMADSEKRRTFTSHAFAGVFGGAANGYLYQKRPLPGMIFFVPVMLACAQAELEWKRRRDLRIEQILEEQKSEEDEKDEDATVSQ